MLAGASRRGHEFLTGVSVVEGLVKRWSGLNSKNQVGLVVDFILGVALGDRLVSQGHVAGADVTLCPGLGFGCAESSAAVRAVSGPGGRSL